MSVRLKDIQKTVQAEFDEFEPFFRNSMKGNIRLLNLLQNYVLRQKGKQLRPLLVFLTAKSFGTPNKSTYVAASLIELLHTASLVHDDVVDESFERRGAFSVFALWKAKISVLFGDFLLAKGLLLAIDNKEYELLNIVSEAVKEISEGELLQIQKSISLDITREEYYEIIKKKTAALIAACTACGAKSVNCSDDMLNKAKLFGEYTGIAFQIKDDLLDYNGKKNILGKPVGNDMKEKKITLPLLYSLEIADRSERRRIKSLIRGSKKRHYKIDEIKRFVVEKGGIDHAFGEMMRFKNLALELLRTFPENETNMALANLVEYIVSREK